MLSPEVAARLERARAAEKDYQPNDAVASQLAEKTLVMFVAPVAVGKSFLMNRTVETDGDFSRVPVFTTRDPREDVAPGLVRCFPHDVGHVSALLDIIENGEIVQYAVHPTSGRIYGSEITDYPNEYNMLATLSGGVEQLRKLPFKGTSTLGIAVRPDIWLQRLDKRYPEASSERTKRLAEAALSLDWLLADQDATIIDNTASDPNAAVQSIISAVRFDQDSDPNARHYLEELHRIIKEEL